MIEELCKVMAEGGGQISAMGGQVG